MSKPILEIQRDLVKISQMLINVGTFVDARNQVSNERFVRKLMKRYGVRAKKQPTYLATTK